MAPAPPTHKRRKQESQSEDQGQAGRAKAGLKGTRRENTGGRRTKDVGWELERADRHRAWHLRRAYRYGISIRSGYVYYGGGGVNFTGHVAANGTVNVRVTSGGAFADGSGRLSRNVGQGFWSGQSGGSGCSGYWTAERRG